MFGGRALPGPLKEFVALPGPDSLTGLGEEAETGEGRIRRNIKEERGGGDKELPAEQYSAYGTVQVIQDQSHFPLTVPLRLLWALKVKSHLFKHRMRSLMRRDNQDP